MRRWQQAKGGKGRVALLSASLVCGKSRLVLALPSDQADEHFLIDIIALRITSVALSTLLMPALNAMPTIQKNDNSEQRLEKLKSFLSPSGPSRWKYRLFPTCFPASVQR